MILWLLYSDYIKKAKLVYSSMTHCTSAFYNSTGLVELLNIQKMQLDVEVSPPARAIHHHRCIW